MGLAIGDAAAAAAVAVDVVPAWAAAAALLPPLLPTFVVVRTGVVVVAAVPVAPVAPVEDCDTAVLPLLLPPPELAAGLLAAAGPLEALVGEEEFGAEREEAAGSREREGMVVPCVWK